MIRGTTSQLVTLALTLSVACARPQVASAPPAAPLRESSASSTLPAGVDRARQIIVVTTLLVSAKYPPEALSQLYFRRWAMELTLRNIKTTLQMDQLSCKNPQNLEREIRMHFLVHNLVRRLMLAPVPASRPPLPSARGGNRPPPCRR